MTAWAANLEMPGKKFKYSYGVRTVPCDSKEHLVGIKVVRIPPLNFRVSLASGCCPVRDSF